MRLERIVRVAGGLAAVATMMIMFQVVIDSATRTLLGSSVLSGTFEHVQYWWMPLLVFGGLAMAETQNEHITAPVLYDRVSTASKRIWLLAGNGVTVMLVGALAYYGWFSASDARALGESRGATDVPIWPLRFWLVAGVGLYALAVISSTRRQLRHLGDEECVDEPAPSGGSAL